MILENAHIYSLPAFRQLPSDVMFMSVEHGRLSWEPNQPKTGTKNRVSKGCEYDFLALPKALIFRA